LTIAIESISRQIIYLMSLLARSSSKARAKAFTV